MDQPSPRTIAAGIALLIAGAAIGYGAGQAGDTISPDEAGERVQDAFASQGDDVTIESVTRETPSLYKVVIASSGDLSRIYMTRDGSHIIQDPVNVSSYTRQASERASFLDCLEEEQVQIVGDSSRNATITQLQILGGTSGLEDIYIEMDNRTRATLVQQGVTTVPVTIHNGTIHEGVKTVGFLEERTGCEYGPSDRVLR